MERPRAIITAAYAGVVAAAWLIGSAASLSSSSSTHVRRTPRSSSLVPPSSPAVRSCFDSPPRLGFSESCGGPLRSSLKETFETEGTNETQNRNIDGDGGTGFGHYFNDIGHDAGTKNGSRNNGGGTWHRQQLRQVLSPPELIDPAAILDATVGAPEVTVESLAASVDEPSGVTHVTTATVMPLATAKAIDDGDSGQQATHDDYTINEDDEFGNDILLADLTGTSKKTVTPSTVSSSRAARSKEEDLELTRQVIMRHIDQISVGSNGIVEEDEDRDEGDYENCLAGHGATEENSQKQKLGLGRSGGLKITDHNLSAKLVAPSISKILRFTIPAIGIWLCSPVLSMIDTAAVGLLSGTAQQAALNPAVSVTDYGALVVAFMYTATTNLIAAAVQEDKDDKETGSLRPKTTRTLITALKLALLVGSIFGVVLGASGKILLQLLIGNDALDPAVFSAALRYVRIRSLGMPATVVIGTAQSACLGMQDVKSPLYVLMAAAAVNFFGDVLLVPRTGALGGAAGAAWATVASQYAALLFFARWLTTASSSNDADDASQNDAKKRKMNLLFWKKRRNDQNEVHTMAKFASSINSDENNNQDAADVINVTQGIMELTGTSKAGQSRRKEFSKFLTSSKLSRGVCLGNNDRSLDNMEKKRFPPDNLMPVAMDIVGEEGENNTIRPVTKMDEMRSESPTRKSRSQQQPETRGFLSNSKITLRSYLSLSTLDKLKAKEFLPFVVPVTTTSVGRISGYIAMSHVASSTLGTYDMAGHQIVFSIFCCLTPFVDALSQVAQSFVPAVFESKEKSRERARALSETVMNFRKVGLGFGAVLVSLVACIPLISRYFTTDPIVLERVNGAIPGVGMFMLANGLMCAGEGTLLGQKDLKFLRNMYAIFFFTVPAYMLRLKYRALAGAQVVGIGTMWAAFSRYNLIRTLIWHLRLALLQRRTDRGAATVDGGDVNNVNEDEINR